MLTDFDLAKQAQAVTAEVVKRSMMGQIKHAFGVGSADLKFVTAEPVLNTNSFVGTEEYLAPEVITGLGHSSAVDWWTFGILVYEMAFGGTPFKGASQGVTFQNITSKEFKIHIPDQPSVSSGCKKLVRGLLNRDVTKRLGSKHGASELRKHPFFEGIKWSLVGNMKPPYIPSLRNPYDTSHFTHIPDEADPVLDSEVPWAPGCGPGGSPDAFVQGQLAREIPRPQPLHMGAMQAGLGASMLSPIVGSPNSADPSSAGTMGLTGVTPQPGMAPLPSPAMQPGGMAMVAPGTQGTLSPPEQPDPFNVFNPQNMQGALSVVGVPQLDSVPEGQRGGPRQ
mmetsp:Transcript_18716/g.40590  ORF Transcript_18716/g.40590 Transcript_18716/m.40590 type:complete len:337 (+) Transcript_18716:77-1087(+)